MNGPVATERIGYRFFLQPPAVSATVAAINGIDVVSDYPGVDTITVHQGPGAVLDWKDGSRNHIMAVVGTADDYDELRAVNRLLHDEVTVTYANRESRRVTVRLVQVAEHDALIARVSAIQSHSRARLSTTCPTERLTRPNDSFSDCSSKVPGSDVIEVRRYTMVGVPRGEETSRRIAEQYFPLADLYLDPPDVLIVTGSNPIEVHIEDEPYWGDLVELLTWAREHVGSTLLSCLSAHAALRSSTGSRAYACRRSAPVSSPNT